MIDISAVIHEYIASLDVTADGKNVLERMVFGGDVLTNERAYGAQMDMINGITETDHVLGLLHHPEGLHLCMNLCHYLMARFYTSSSSADEGTLYTRQ
jgi:hypothetical protein